MTGDVERIKEVEYQMQKLEEAYGKECAELYKQRGFDMYAPKWNKKIEKLAKKYADLLTPLKLEHDDLRIRLNTEEEIRRKAKYKDISN